MPLYHLCAGERSCTGLSSAAAALPPRRGAPLASCSPITCSRPSTAHPSHARAPLTVLHASSTAPSATALRVPPVAGPRDNTATCCSTPSAVPVPARPASGVPASTYCPRSARYRTPAAYRAEVTAAATSSNDMSLARARDMLSRARGVGHGVGPAVGRRCRGSLDHGGSVMHAGRRGIHNRRRDCRGGGGECAAGGARARVRACVHERDRP